MRKKVMSFFVICSLTFMVAALAFAQESKETTVTGCLNKTDTAGMFVIQDEATKKPISVSGDPAMLERHANNHKVTLTGTLAKEKEKEVFKATKLQMLALCQ